MSLRLAVLLSAFLAFISLSYEVVWFRAFSFATGGTAGTFGILIGVFLAGIAFGARIAEKRIRSGDERAGLWTDLAVRLFIANLLAFAVIPMMGVTVEIANGMLAFEGVGLAAVGWGAALPLISHLAVNADEAAGRKVSYMYAANIVGSVAGTLLTGFVFMDVMSLETICAILAATGLVSSVLLIAFAPAGKTTRFIFTGVGALVSIGALLLTPKAFDRIFEKLLFKERVPPAYALAAQVENRSGVITVLNDGQVFGSGAYDGRISTDLVADSNDIVRAYAVAALHPNPGRVLVIGLSTGAWTQVVANIPSVDSVTVVEINPGYLELIARYRPVRSLLKNPKVNIVIDDGRRWLRRNPDEKFDAIVMNTTLHWRAHSSNLLSVEFLALARSHLKPGGILHYNTTGSREAVKTGLSSFPYGLRFMSMATVSDSPITWHAAKFREVLANFSIDGKKVFDLSLPEHRAALDRVATMGEVTTSTDPKGVESREHALSRLASARVVTDDNMIPEWKTAWINRLLDR